MQSYYLHSKSSPSLRLKNIKPYRLNDDQQFVVGTRGTQLQMYKLLDDDLAYHNRFVFYANIDKIQVIPSNFHQYDYIWILDTKGRFCCWHPQGVDIVNNTILWDQNQSKETMVFSGLKYQFEDKRTQGNIFYCKGLIFILLKFTISQKGIAIDQNNIIKYPLQPSNIRFINWIQHDQSLFLVGTIIQQEAKTTLCIYDLEKGLGLSNQALQWKFEKANLLQFYSLVAGEILILTYNQISLHNYKHHYPLKNYRTRGNYGQGFYLEEGLYGHIGEELITFNRDKLISYGQVKTDSTSSFSNLCLTQCTIVGQLHNNGTAAVVQTYEGDVYFLRLFSKTSTIYRIFTAVGPILDMCCVSKSQSLLAVVSQSSNGFEVSLLQREYRSQIKEQSSIDNKMAQKLFTINGGIYIILCNQSENEVFRLTRNQQYQSYFLLPQGNIIAADGQFVIYDNAIYEIDYQCFALTPIQQIQILLAEIGADIIYYLDYQGNIHVFDNQQDSSNIVSKARQEDYCWGIIKKNNVLLTANLKQPKTIKLINNKQIKSISIKGHTLVSSLSSVSFKKSRYDSDDRVLVGYADGQIHMHNMRNDTFYSTYVFEAVGAMPVSFCVCGDDTVLANFIDKQYLITANKDQCKLVRICCSNYSSSTYLFGFLQKTTQIVYIHTNSNIIKKMNLNPFKKYENCQQSKLLRTIKLQDWRESVPMLLRLNDRLAVGGFNKICLFSLQTIKPISIFHHNFTQIIGLSQIKMGIIICGICPNKKEYILLLTQQLQLICRLELHSNPPVRCMKVLENQNEFLLAYDDYLTLYKITDSLQLLSLMGSKIHLQAYTMDTYRNTILINDPFKNLAILQYSQSIHSLAIYMPSYTIVNALFIGKDVLFVDERGSITILSAQIQQQIDLVFKFTKIFTIHTGSKISAIYHLADIVYYANEQGKIGIIKLITRDQFDYYKKIQTELCLQFDQNMDFCYWQWRNKVPAHERMIDGQMLGDHMYSKQLKR